MKAIIEVLEKNPTVFLATVQDGKPKVRPFQFQFVIDGKFYFCTSNTKEVYKQIKNCPFVEFSATTPDFVTVRVSGQAQFSNDMKIKERIIDNNELIRSIYNTADNPIFEIFYIEHGDAILFDFSGQPPQKYNF